MTIQARRKREKDHLRQKILDAAEELILDEGPDRLSMRKLAEKIEYSTTTIYLYFDNKQTLIHHLLRNIYLQLLHEFEKACAQKPDDPMQRLRMLMEIYINFGLGHPAHYKMLFIVDATGIEESIRGASGLDAFQLIVKTVEQGIREGFFREDDPGLISQSIWATMHGIVSLLILRPRFPWTDRGRLIANIIGITIAGLRKR